MLFRYKVISCEPSEEMTFRDAGIVFAKTLAKATKRLAEYFGEDNIIKLQIEPMGEDSIMMDSELGDIINPSYYKEYPWRYSKETPSFED